MNISKPFLLGCLLAALAVIGVPPNARAGTDGMEILTRGPVHEAFAGIVGFDPEPGIIITTAPPPMIEELPPEHQLTGENIVWIPGYWTWEEDHSDFIWISGIWRNLPPGRQWIPGYWDDLNGSHQWISGYWEDAAATQITYLPPPPRSIEVGPNISAPSVNHHWVPGHWTYRQTRYAWSPGFWTPVREHWSYIPARYVWTPRGHIFVAGYWDHTIVHRGVLFAPVHFARPVFHTPGFYYRPTTVISLTFFTNHLFLRPSYGHYFFGDYYAPRYRTVGLVPVFEHHYRRGGYDPIYVHQRWQHRGDRDWERRHRADYTLRRDNERARPPRTWTALQERRDDRDWGRDRVAAPLEDYASRGGDRFRRTDRQTESRLVEQRSEVQRYRGERERLEGRGSAPSAPERTEAESRVIPRSPIAGRPIRDDDRRTGPDSPTAPGERPTRPRPSAEREERPTSPERPFVPEDRRGDRPEQDRQRETRAPEPSIGPAAERRAAPETRGVPRAEAVPEQDRRGTPEPRTTRPESPAPRTVPQPPTRQNEPRSVPQPQSRPTPRSVPQPARPAPAPRAVPQPQSRPAPRSVPQPARPAPAPRAVPQPQSRPAPQSVPQPARPAPAPRAVPQPQSRPTPRSVPQPARPAPAPRAVPQPQSRPAPRSVPQPARPAPAPRAVPQPQSRPAPQPRSAPPATRSAPERPSEGRGRGQRERGR